MKTWIYTLSAIIVLLSFINFYSYKRLSKCNQEISNLNVSKSDNHEAYYRGKIINEAIHNNQIIFNSKDIYIQNASGAKVSLKDINNINQKLFFSFSPIDDCSTCITETFLSLKDKFKNPDKIVVLSFDTNFNDLSIISQKYDIKFDVYTLKKSDLLKSVVNFNKPFLFTLNKDFVTNSLFFIETDGNPLTNEFLSQISFK